MQELSIYRHWFILGESSAQTHRNDGKLKANLKFKKKIATLTEFRVLSKPSLKCGVKLAMMTRYWSRVDDGVRNYTAGGSTRQNQAATSEEFSTDWRTTNKTTLGLFREWRSLWLARFPTVTACGVSPSFPVWWWKLPQLFTVTCVPNYTLLLGA